MAASSSSPDVIMEERHNELMISPCGGNPTPRSAHFLIPILPFSSLSPPSPCSASTELTTIYDSKKTHIKSLLQSHRHPSDKWKAWVDHLKPTYQEIWNQAGIYHSIMSSTQKIPKDNSLIIGLAERWCLESNTFIFPWGEATLTLEDMAVLGGYSVLGDSVLCPLRTEELVEICSGLRNALKEIRMNGSNAATHCVWMDYFMATGKKFEHQAFLVFWLSRFVFTRRQYITVDLFSIAIHLANGTLIALAPAVLAGFYRDLRLLKKVIVNFSKLGDNGCSNEVLMTPLSSPFQLLQLWVWKRFHREPRLSQRHETRSRDVNKVREALNSAEECFLWRPYALGSINYMFSKLYKENESWVLVDSIIDKELEMYARCLRVSELVGLDCIEQYLPNRVAMQFGFDQDIPGDVARANVSYESYDDAWSNYNRPIRDVKLYVPARLSEADVTSRYLKWYKGSTETEDSFKSVDIKRGTPLLVRHVSSLTCDREEAEDYIDEDKMFTAKLVGCKRKRTTSSDAMCVGAKHVMKETDSRGKKDTLVASDGDFKQAEFVIEPINMSTESLGRPKNRTEETGLKEEKDTLVASDGEYKQAEFATETINMCKESLGRPKSRVEETNSREKKDTMVSNIRDEDKGSWDGTTFKLPELELEVRISRLERQAATLIAAKYEEKHRKVS